MIPLRLSVIADVANGRLFGDDIEINSVTTDSRVVSENELFVALKGDKFDAHDFLLSAIDNGAKALIVSKKPSERIDVPYVLVDDTKIALGKMSAYVKKCVSPITIGITGTCGKTSVKDMTYSIFSENGLTLATKGNFNNDIGVPLTLLRLTFDTKFAIVEMGTNHPGEISYSTNLVKPDICLINNVGFAHLEGFGSLDGVYKAKSEIFEGLVPGGTAIFNATSEFYPAFIEQQSKFRLLGFGFDEKAEIYASNIVVNSTGSCSFLLNSPKGTIDINLNVLGKHNVLNACAAASIAYGCGLSLDEIKKGLEKYNSYQGRLQQKKINNLTLIDDAYNASVNAVYAAIDTLDLMTGYKILILGDMGELGEKSNELHKNVGEKVKYSSIDLLLCVGELTKFTVNSAEEKAHFFVDKSTLCEQLNSFIPKEKDTIILVKGSHSMKMHEILEYIEEKLC